MTLCRRRQWAALAQSPFARATEKRPVGQPWRPACRLGPRGIANVMLISMRYLSYMHGLMEHQETSALQSLNPDHFVFKRARLGALFSDEGSEA